MKQFKSAHAVITLHPFIHFKIKPFKFVYFVLPIEVFDGSWRTFELAQRRSMFSKLSLWAHFKRQPLEAVIPKTVDILPLVFTSHPMVAKTAARFTPANVTETKRRAPLYSKNQKMRRATLKALTKRMCVCVSAARKMHLWGVPFHYSQNPPGALADYLA